MFHILSPLIFSIRPCWQKQTLVLASFITMSSWSLCLNFGFFIYKENNNSIPHRGVVRNKQDNPCKAQTCTIPSRSKISVNRQPTFYTSKNPTTQRNSITFCRRRCVRIHLAGPRNTALVCTVQQKELSVLVVLVCIVQQKELSVLKEACSESSSLSKGLSQPPGNFSPLQPYSGYTSTVSWFLLRFLRAGICAMLTLKAIKYLMNEQNPFIN